MTQRSEYHTLESMHAAEDVKPARSRVPSTAQLVKLALVLALLAVCLRLGGMRDALPATIVNTALLKAAMKASMGVPVSPVAVATDIPTSFPPTPFQTRAMSEIAQRAGKQATAEAWLVRGLSDPATAYLSQFELCLLYWNAAQYGRAREACRGTKESAVYWLNRGYVADQEGERAEALIYFQMAGSINPGMGVAWQQTGNALFALGRYEEAIPAFERVLALEKAPTASVYQSLGRAHLQQKDAPAARKVLDEGLAAYPNQRGLYMLMAETYHKERDWAAADEWYDRLLQQWPSDYRGWAARGEVALADGRPRDAMSYYREAVKIRPEGDSYWMSLATAATAAGNMALASTSYRQAMELRPDDAALWMRAGRHLAQANQHDEARAVFEHVLELEPSSSEATTELARLDDAP